MIIEMRAIDGYPNYKVTSDGRVWSENIKRYLAPSIVAGYYRVSLCRDGNIKNYQIHRLVAKAFLQNDKGLPMVNHKDENKLNNSVDNLEWCDATYNNNYGTAKERQSMTQRNRKDCSKPVVQYTLDGVFVAEYPSCKEAKRQTGIGHISECCKHYKNQYTAGGFVWKWKV